MQPLLKISSVPITIEYTTKRATFQPSDNPEPRPAFRPRGLNLRAQAPRIQVGPSGARAPQPQQQRARNMSDPAQQRTAAAPSASTLGGADSETANVEGVVLPSSDIDVLGLAPVVEPAPQYVAEPMVQAQTASQAVTPVSYQMDRTMYDWSVNSAPQLEFVPASLEFSVSQYNDVVIEYMGGPIYVPPSANPDYVPLPGDLDA